MSTTDRAGGLAAVAARLPEHAKDLRLNLGAVSRSEHLSPQQLWGTLLATAEASRNAQLLAAVTVEARPHLSEQAFAAARTAAALMAMNNVYYRFVHLVESESYARLPARLRMHGLANHGVDRLDVELWSLAVSAVNGCGSCVAGHERKLAAGGLRPEAVQDAVRIAAVVHAVAVTLDAEDALGGG